MSDTLPSSRRLAALFDPRTLAVLAVRYGLFLALGLWVITMSFASEHFLTWLNILNVARQTAPILIIAVGMTFVVATAGIDLSVGSLVALISVLAASWLAAGLPVYFSIPAVLVIGTLVGLVNGLFVTWGLPAFVVTLAGLTYIRGIAFVYSDGYAIPVQDETFQALGRGEWLGIHTPIWIAAVVALLGWWVLTQTRFGLYTVAVGGREEAARVMGLNIRAIKLTVYGATGFLAALAALVIAARLSNGSPNAGVMLELDVIAATVLGGTSLFGGVATLGGTIAGALFINFVRNGLNLIGVDPYWVQVATGVILLLAVLLNTVVNRKVEEWARTAAGPEED